MNDQAKELAIELERATYYRNEWQKERALNADLLNLLTAADRLEELTGENLAVYARTFAALARATIAKATGV